VACLTSLQYDICIHIKICPISQARPRPPYINGLRHGIESEWYDNGKRKLENIFEFDVLMKSTTWSESGDILDEYERPSDDVLYKMVEKEKKTRSLRLFVIYIFT
jgi:hypothetical protein